MWINEELKAKAFLPGLPGERLCKEKKRF